MNKLTDEQMERVRIDAGIAGSEMMLQILYRFARAIEAEVLRLNGWQPIETAPKDGARIVARGNNFGDQERGQHYCTAIFFNGCWMEASDWSPTSELQYLTHWTPLPDESLPRATGCPDTMDETAEVAVAMKQAVEEKSPPATGPAG